MFDPPYPPYDPTDPKRYVQHPSTFNSIVLTLVFPPAFRESQSITSGAHSANTRTDQSFETLVRRWPAILTSIADHLHRVGHELATQPNGLSPSVVEERIEAGKSVIEKINKIKYEMGTNKPLLYGPIKDPQSVLGID